MSKKVFKTIVFTDRELFNKPELAVFIERKNWSLSGLGNPKVVEVERQPWDKTIIIKYK